MSFSRAAIRLLSSRTACRQVQRQGRVATRRARSSTATEKAAEGPEPPNGFLFNEKPLYPGEKRQKEEWENIYVIGMTVNLLLCIAIVTLKPDTSTSTWARQKATERLENKSKAKTSDSSDQ